MTEDRKLEFINVDNNRVTLRETIQDPTIELALRHREIVLDGKEDTPELLRLAKETLGWSV